jgi:LuxR family maltose regulon positive regulatory protein
MDRGVVGPLTLLCAPAGYGKTNLLVEWMHGTSLPVAWLTIDNDDNDLKRFFRYLIGAMQSLEPNLGAEALDFIQSARGSGLEIGLTLLINEIASLPNDNVLVLDDFQALNDPILLQGINFLLRNLPQNLHLVIASRSEPALDLAALRAKGRVIELGMEDLRFTGQEIGLFFQQVIALRLPAEALHALEKRTDGWVTALQMAALSLRQQPDPTKILTNLEGEAHFLVDFLAEEVLDRQPEEIRQFLLRSSVLNTLTGPLCEAVVKPEAQPGYGMVVLNHLEHEKLFITALDEKHEWFRYHSLFADFLCHIHAEINPLEIPVLQKRAAVWFEQNGNLEEAFQYALSSGDMEWTADLIERNINTLIKTGEVFSLTRWIGQLPDAVIQERINLSLPYAWALIASYRLELASYWLDHVRRKVEELENQTNAVPQADNAGNGLWNIRGGLAVCQSTLALLSQDWDKAAAYSRQANQLLQEGNPFIQSFVVLDDSLYCILSGDTTKAIESLRDTVQIARRANNLLVMIIATCQIADMQALQGKLNQAWDTLHKAQFMAMGPDGKPMPLAGLADIGLGEISLERNDLKEANMYLERGMKATGTMWWLSNLDGMVSLAHLLQVKGDVAGAQAVIEEASRMTQSTESSQLDDTIISAMAVRLALQREDLPLAEQWWRRGAFPDYRDSIHLENYAYHIYEYLVLTQVRLLIAIGRRQGNESYLRRCAVLLESLLHETTRFQRVTSTIEIQVLQAIVQFSLGETEQAVITFRSALALGEPEGYRRIYLDSGRPVSELLALCQSELKESNSPLPSAAFIESLQEALRGEAQLQPGLPSEGERSEPLPVKKDEGPPVSLSAREMEVLRLIADGKSNQEIAAQLYLALNTVKRHAYNIYAKLEVTKRTQAVSKARKLGLLP